MTSAALRQKIQNKKTRKQKRGRDKGRDLRRKGAWRKRRRERSKQSTQSRSEDEESRCSLDPPATSLILAVREPKTSSGGTAACEAGGGCALPDHSPPPTAPLTAFHPLLIHYLPVAHSHFPQSWASNSARQSEPPALDDSAKGNAEVGNLGGWWTRCSRKKHLTFKENLPFLLQILAFIIRCKSRKSPFQNASVQPQFTVLCSAARDSFKHTVKISTRLHNSVWECERQH